MYQISDITKREKKRKVRRSLFFSFWDGFFASIQFGIIDQFATPIALFMGANNIAIGWLNFIRNTLVSTIQASSADATLALRSRKRLITACVFIAAMLWIPTFFVPFMFKTHRVAVFIVLFSITSSFNMFATPAWASLMSEYIPHTKRGRYFGWRATTLGIVYSVSVIAGGIFLNYCNSFNLFLGFAVLMIAAAASRFISWFFLTLMYEPAWRVRTTDYFSFFSFISKLPTSNFARFAFYSAIFMVGVALAAPFFPVYMLTELKLSYFEYTILMGATVFTSLVTQQYWGNFTDRYGNLRIFKVAVFLISLVPFFWVLSRNFTYLVLLQLWAGFLWAGLTLSSTNFIYDVAISTKRERCIAYFNFLTGAGLGVGALAGGFLYGLLPPTFNSRFISLFLASGFIRFCGAFCIMFLTKEVKKVEETRFHTLLFDLSGIRAIGLFGKELLVRQRKREDK